VEIIKKGKEERGTVTTEIANEKSSRKEHFVKSEKNIPTYGPEGVTEK